MGHMSIWHWLIVLFVVLLLFGGRGKISQIAGDLGRGITAFRKNLKLGEGDGEGDKAEQARPIADAARVDPAPGQPRAATTETERKERAAGG